MKRRSRRKKSKRSYKKRSKRSYKKRSRSKISSKKKSVRMPKFRLTIDYGIGNYNIDSGINYDFKLIEWEGCPSCINAKKLIKDKGYSMDVKKELNSEESKIIKDTTGGTYDFFPKIFKYNDKTGKYDFVGGYDKLQKII